MSAGTRQRSATPVAQAPQVPDPPTLFGAAGAALELVERARTGLSVACQATAPEERFSLAHLAALRAAAALLAGVGFRTGPGRSRSRPRSVWQTVATEVPEFSSWTTLFEYSARRRQQIDRGMSVPAAEADGLLRSAERFLELVLERLGLPVQPSVLAANLRPEPATPVPVTAAGGAPVGGVGRA